ncbi:MAG: beta-ketoacyl-[acyl-carrier-protein] synthase II [Candidatus Raymondbacteria bacterium RifOxyB12_full_50_8]|uniref:3-oxoacyl-[acyl-carrier-protein] synthase 2 n=1 Tax=Candidatus Raymondbacteria bacterium RIFOXYD12_FULL_49_13 TaxID=1817890 RepID=A0A1F7FCP2_UNCRA|nr:MAG: beta-ketoacyl-[acyl-carrier-protein] synthase II [Candidatus Raymondbacteria bacterium RIFOXYA2_FULL_49_16]OGJ93277.1 MAG: beta-ketoacyl-[acyl-carrier-protein] synthase II [Candidatus Raymondbacteria bacterium RifOxyB12_full_50_8]OGK04237.1 MAG: beta-ketoacyl-[acyl-carrier-protein] synthase II [Candidatus Raymondbacteria bacterium RIFOXYD12_FULL_49_13]OGP42480.1 MAG: beta-ketoacyl-[acyl-carrier-protein] synthase II [Candidatus Raymondbacteria bacterium RIFOXYB2_FULL_49_35]
MKKVVITGMGVVTPVGSTLEKFWNALLNGQSGLNLATKVDRDKYPVKVVGEVKDYNPENFMSKKEVRRMDLFVQYAVGAAAMAIQDAKLDMKAVNADRVGCVIGSGIGGLNTLQEQHRILLEKGPDRVSPFFIPMMIADMASGMVSIINGAKGPNFACVSACASSAHALGESLKLIRYGEADVMISGGAEATICDMGMAGFCSARAMSMRFDPPSKSSCPFDKKRDGFVMGEGAGIIILESEEHALARGARIYAEFCGAGYSSDAYHMTAPAEGGEGAARAIRAALASAQLGPETVDYINAHGTSTELNDKNETAAIKTVFGQRAYDINISSTKSMVGHLLGASGSVELIASALSLQNGVVPPTINYEDPDPDCDLNYTPNTAVKRDIKVAISNSFGFGGHNACLVLRKT